MCSQLPRYLAGVAAMVLVLQTDLQACPICFRVEDGPVVSGVQAAVAVLMSVTGAVLLGLGAFIARFVRRSSTGPANEDTGL